MKKEEFINTFFKNEKSYTNFIDTHGYILEDIYGKGIFFADNVKKDHIIQLDLNLGKLFIKADNYCREILIDKKNKKQEYAIKELINSKESGAISIFDITLSFSENNYKRFINDIKEIGFYVNYSDKNFDTHSKWIVSNKKFEVYHEPLYGEINRYNMSVVFLLKLEEFRDLSIKLYEKGWRTQKTVVSYGWHEIYFFDISFEKENFLHHKYNNEWKILKKFHSDVQLEEKKYNFFKKKYKENNYENSNN